jgi:DNA phosphorothioation-associated putative methyltransferase
MKFEEYKELVRAIKIGKHLPESIYLHKSALSEIDYTLSAVTIKIANALKIPDDKWTLVKYSKRDFKLSLLYYPTFFNTPYPALHESYTIDLAKMSVREAKYDKSDNPPILHRRETFLAPNHPQTDYLKEFTLEGEKIGLYEKTRTIGFEKNWLSLIRRKGYYLDDDNHLQPLINKPQAEIVKPFSGDIERHKTALTRDKLSTPMFLLAQRGFLNQNYSVLDYGCGKGDDLRELEAHGIECIGWDPVHKPDVDLSSCDIVNLGFVINVIEDREERIETLKRAYSYSEKLILVSAMLGNESVFEQYKPYKDGVITKRNTFQKYYMQGELQQFIENTLSENAIPIGAGVFIVFKDKIEEQNYLLERQRTRHSWRQISKPAAKPISQKKSKDLFERHQPLFEDFWYTCLELARLPHNDEFDLSEQLRHISGSHQKAFTVCKHVFGISAFEQAQKERENDLLVYFSLSFFKKRDSYLRMPQSLQRDIKQFFGKYSNARELGKSLLFSMSDIDVIYNACIQANDTLPASELNGQHDLIFHKDYLNLCPLELRVYIGCALQIYGELDEVSLIKAHIHSGKVSLMIYDDWKKDQPLLKERIKIKLREQDIDFFDYYGSYERPPLENKLDFIS